MGNLLENENISVVFYIEKFLRSNMHSDFHSLIRGYIMFNENLSQLSSSKISNLELKKTSYLLRRGWASKDE